MFVSIVCNDKFLLRYYAKAGQMTAGELGYGRYTSAPVSEHWQQHPVSKAETKSIALGCQSCLEIVDTDNLPAD
jgi:hypothetical protein